eukprot:COSAG02_NODE_5652_length_4149_cov_5.477037_1_plen_103_part_00
MTHESETDWSLRFTNTRMSSVRSVCGRAARARARRRVVPRARGVRAFGRPQRSRGRGMIPYQCWWLEVVPRSASTRLRRIGQSAFETCSISTMKIMRLTATS